MEKQPVRPHFEENASMDDEIDLFELWNGLVEEKMTILFSFLAVMFIALVYLFLAKPQYAASVVLQVQQIQQVQSTSPVKSVSENGAFYFSIENPNKTIHLLKGIVPAEISTERGDNGFITISSTGFDKKQIKQNMVDTIKLIESRYQKIFSKIKSLGYLEILPTKIMGEIKVTDKPVKPKKALILAVSGVLGLMLGVFIALIRRAIKNRQAMLAAS